jgi:exodeoxyribonuclease VIII
MTPGIHTNITFDRYIASPAMNHSTLRQMARSAWHCKHYTGGDDSLAKRAGRALHAWVLERATWSERWAVWDGERRGKTWDSFAAAADMAGQEVITKAEHDDMLGQAKAISLHREARWLRNQPGETEVVLVWDEPSLGLCKARVDKRITTTEPNILLDLKTTRDASRHSFSRSLMDYGYHTQAAWYELGASRLGLPRSQFTLLAVESDAPYGVAVYQIGERSMAMARDQIATWTAEYIRCRGTGQWPMYHDEGDIDVPEWALRQYQRFAVEDAR